MTRPRDKIEVKCKECNKPFEKPKKDKLKKYCSKKCYRKKREMARRLMYVKQKRERESGSMA